jgi:hypothetical protein
METRLQSKGHASITRCGQQLLRLDHGQQSCRRTAEHGHYGVPNCFHNSPVMIVDGLLQYVEVVHDPTKRGRITNLAVESG